MQRRRKQRINVLLVGPNSQHRSGPHSDLGAAFNASWVSNAQEASRVISTSPPEAVVAVLESDNPLNIQNLSRLISAHPDVPMVVIDQKNRLREPVLPGFEDVVIIRDDSRERVVLGIHLAMSLRSMPPALAAVIDTFCGGFTDPIVILDQNLQCIYSNEPAVGYMALVSGEVIGKKLFELIPDFDTSPAREELSRALTLRTPAKFEHYFSSQRVWLSCMVVPWRAGISVIMTNVADYRRIDAQWKENVRNFDVDDQTTLVRDLAFRLTQTEQRERRRLAQLLHDNLLQLLVTARMRMNVLRAKESAAPLNESLLQIDSLIKDSIEMSRSVVLELSPPVLHESGLRSAFQWLSEHMKQTYGLKVDLTFSAKMEPHEEERLLLFEAARELLFNVVKHSGADAASVTVSSEGSRLILSVEDSGRGFNSESFLRDSARSEVFGLFSIRQRVELVGGQLEIANRSPQGTCITLTLPIRSD